MDNRSTKILKEIIINEIQERPSTKSKILSKVKSNYWEGYVSSNFVLVSRAIDGVFNNLVREKCIVFENRKPLKLTKKGIRVIDK